MSPYQSFSKRVEWEDVVPVPQDDGDDPVVPIAYSFQFRETMDYFRAMLLSDERSERSLQLTEEVIQLNAANYTVWHFRRQILFTLQKDLHLELDFIDQLVQDIPKNYQIWHHRREIADHLNHGSRELEFTENALRGDEKNYHSWAHRQWAIQRFQLWDKELEFVDEMLRRDLRNNSAWNHRWFIISNTAHSGNIGELNKEIRTQELKYAISFITRAPNNESPWNYIRGLMRHQIYREYPEIKELCLSLKESSPFCVFNLALLVDIFIQEATVESKEQALELVHQLTNEVDGIRKKYWKSIMISIRAM